MIVKLIERETDDFGSGYFGASRGSRIHRGSDLSCFPGTIVFSPVAGHITKLGYPYGDDLTYRYVEITDYIGKRHRIFYCLPNCSVGDVVSEQSEIGTVQDISKRYDTEDKKMNNHIHYEIILDGEYLDPGGV